MLKLTTPISLEEISKLRAGDRVLLSGKIVTARDAAHKLMVEERPAFLDSLLKESVIYHCGPIVKKTGDEWKFISAGPTTSSREEPYQATVIKNYNVRGVIGKGGMGDRTMEALKKHGAVYFHAVGGSGAMTAQCVKKVHEVHLLEELGTPEAFWVIEVEDFPLVVTMDTVGNSVHKDVLERSTKNAEKIMSEI